jgi:myo-inositol 2-dehydrogenase/D-chiro-inositol 1-dehydrogenase
LLPTSTPKMSGPKLNIAIAGLGRMGARHALHFYNLTPRANLIAASSPDKKELVWANRNLEGVHTYESYDEMLRVEKENGLQAVIIASATTVHAEQAIKAIEMGLHVLCEKPLSTSVEIVSGNLSMSQNSMGWC